jgi:hypothetical protein
MGSSRERGQGMGSSRERGQGMGSSIERGQGMGGSRERGQGMGSSRERGQGMGSSNALCLTQEQRKWQFYSKDSLVVGAVGLIHSHCLAAHADVFKARFYVSEHELGGIIDKEWLVMRGWNSVSSSQHHLMSRFGIDLTK